MSIVGFAAWLFVFIVLGPLILGLVRIFLPYILGTIIAALHVVPIVLILIVAGVIIGTGLQRPPAHQRYQPLVESGDTLKRLAELRDSDPSFRQSVGLPTPATPVATPQTETPAPRAELVNLIPVTGQP